MQMRVVNPGELARARLLGDGQRDAVVDVPLALAGFARGVTPEGEPLDPREVLRIVMADRERLQAEVQGLRGDVQNLKADMRMLGDNTAAISSVALSLLRMVVDGGGPMVGDREVRIPTSMHERMLGASIRVTTDGDGIRVALRDEGRERVVSEA